MNEKRRHTRYKARDKIYVKLYDEQSRYIGTGKLENISKGGAFLSGLSLSFETAYIIFELDGYRTLKIKCKRADSYRKGCIGMGVNFFDIMDDREIDFFKTERVCAQM